MRFSLVIATLGRTSELTRLFNSLDRQSHRDFELIIVDQNSDARLLPVLLPFENRLDMRRFVSLPGLSRARNVGLRAVTGDFVCFPDDDCWYPEDVLARVNRFFTTNPDNHGIIGDPVDPSGSPILPWRDREGRLTRAMSWRRSISHAIFLHADVIRKVGGFDETLGLGSGLPWGSGEDNDLVLRALDAGFHIRYDPQVSVFHPKLYPAFDEAGLAKRYNYALGDGKLLQKHPMPAWWYLAFFSIPCCRAVLACLRLERKQAYSHWLTMAGRGRGFLSAVHLEEKKVPFPLEACPVLASPTSGVLKARSAAGGR